jgi:release factor glutamine methyltransferase
VAADEEAVELLDAAGDDPGRLAALLARRCAGEPLAWVVGSVRFCDETVLVHPGVYVPRWQSEPMAREAVARLPPTGIGVDLCTGAGAIALVMAKHRPRARVLAGEIDPLALACARANSVTVIESDLARGLPSTLAGLVDVITAVVPYVPTDQMRWLPRDVVAYEPAGALDGGPEGTTYLEQVIHQAGPLLRPGGSLLLELGADQVDPLRPVLRRAGFGQIELSSDEDGDLRAIHCRR